MPSPRMDRLFGADGECFDVAIDHGFFNLHSFLTGIENIKSAVVTVVDAPPDAIQLSSGQAPWLQGFSRRHKPALVLRTDIANVYHRKLPRQLYRMIIPSHKSHGTLQRPIQKGRESVFLQKLNGNMLPGLLAETRRNTPGVRSLLTRASTGPTHARDSCFSSTLALSENRISETE